MDSGASRRFCIMLSDKTRRKLNTFEISDFSEHATISRKRLSHNSQNGILIEEPKATKRHQTKLIAPYNKAQSELDEERKFSRKIDDQRLKACTELETMKSDLKTSTEERKLLETKCQDLELCNWTLYATTGQLKCSLQYMQHYYEYAVWQCSQVLEERSKIYALKEAKDVAEEKLIQMYNQWKQTQVQYNNCKEERTASRQANEIKLSKYREQQQHLEDQLQKTNSQLQNSQDELSQTRERLNEALQISYSQISDLKRRLEKADLIEPASKRHLQQVNEDLQKTKDELQNTKSKLNEALQTPYSQMPDKTHLQEISDLKRRLEKAEISASTSKHQLQQVNDELQKTKAELENTKTFREPLHSQMTENTYLQEISDLKRRLEKAESIEPTSKRQLQLVNEELKHKAKELEDTQRRLNAVTKMIHIPMKEPSHSQVISDLRSQLQVSKSNEAKLDHTLQQTRDTLSKTTSELEDAKTRLNEAFQKIKMKEMSHSHEISDLRQNLEKSKSNEATLNRKLQEVRDNLQKATAELEDTKTRLSKFMGQKLTDNNPNITDLSDQNRPTKLGERFSELYDNEWTDAFQVLGAIYQDERTTVIMLLNILKEADAFCRKEEEMQMERRRKELTKMGTEGSHIPSLITKQIKDCRKALGTEAGQNLLEVYIKKLSQSSTASARDALRVVSFLRESFTLCWLMSIQDPPVVFDRLLQHGEKFNTELYRSYTKAGPLVDFPVWPAIFLHEVGPVLYKGVAQGCDK